MQASGDSRGGGAGLQPSALLQKCDGQDITRKGGKGKSRIMLVMPTHIAFPKGSEGTLGSINKINTNHPELVVPTSEGDLVFVGRFVEVENLCYLGIDLLPRRLHSICSDVITRALVFGAPQLVPSGVLHSGLPGTPQQQQQQQQPLSRGASIRSDATEDVMVTQDTNFLSQVSGENDRTTGAEMWQWVHGCSMHARPSAGGGAAASKRGRSGTPGHVAGDEEEEEEMEVDDIVSDGGSEYADSTPGAKGGVAQKRQASRPSTARSAAKKPVSYNVDDIPSDDGIDDDGSDDDASVAEKKKPVARRQPKANNTPAAKTVKKTVATKSPKAVASSKQATAKKLAAEKDVYDFPSSDSEFCEVVDTPPARQATTGRVARSLNKAPKTYHISSGSEAEFE